MLLAAPRLQQTRDFLPATLREGEEQAQPGELADGYDDWFKLIGQGRETLGQSLPQTTVEDTNINTSFDMEYTEWVEPVTFSGSIAHLAGSKEEGAEEASRHVDTPSEISF